MMIEQTYNFNFSSPLNVSLEKYIEVNSLLRYINLNGMNSFQDYNISDGLMWRYLQNLNFGKYVLLFCFNKYINAFWKYYLTDSVLLLNTVLRFYDKYSKTNEYLPYYMMQKIPCETEFDYAVHFLLYNSYHLDTNHKNIPKEPQQSFTINEGAFLFNRFSKKTFVYPEFDKKRDLKSFHRTFIFSNLGGQGIERYYKFFNKVFRNKYKVLLLSKTQLDNSTWNMVYFNNKYLYMNYDP